MSVFFCYYFYCFFWYYLPSFYFTIFLRFFVVVLHKFSLTYFYESGSNKNSCLQQAYNSTLVLFSLVFFVSGFVVIFNFLHYYSCRFISPYCSGDLFRYRRLERLGLLNNLHSFSHNRNNCQEQLTPPCMGIPNRLVSSITVMSHTLQLVEWQQ